MAADTCSSYLKDLKQASELIHKYVCVTTTNKLYHGFVYSIDPISETVVLSTNINDEININFVIGGSIREVNVCDPPAGHVKHELITDTEVELDLEDVQVKKSRVYNWLLRNLIPIKEVDDVLIVHDGGVRIQAPYRIKDCVSSNPIVLSRVQHLMKNMPEVDLDDKQT